MLVKNIVRLCAVLVLSGVSSIAFSQTFTFSNVLENMDDNGHVVIPDNYTSIGYRAFKNTNVVTVEIPNSINSLGEEAFADTPKLIEVVIPESITRISKKAFYNSALKKITIHPSLSVIDNDAFGHSKLEEIQLYENISIGNYAFHYSKIKHLKLPKNTSLQTGAFQNVPLISLEIEEGLSSGWYTFQSSGNTLQTLVLNSNFGCNAGQGACFYNSDLGSLSYVILGSNVTSISGHSTGLNSIVVLKTPISSNVSASQVLVLSGINIQQSIANAPHSSCSNIDSDNDGHQDCYDQFPNDPDRWFDYSDSAETNTTELVHSDDDGLADMFDKYPTTNEYPSSNDWDDSERTIDTDGDNIHNAQDIDDDDDGLLDTYEPFFGTNPLIPDSDFDGALDGLDAFPLDNTESLDTDADGIGNNADTDDDNDGHFDLLDAFPLDANEWMDSDLDGVGNSADTDDDNDGVLDEEDAFPYTASESVDTDSDGVGDNSDAFPNDSSETLDNDLDGIGNNADGDDDNDGVADAEDSDPLNDSIGALESQNLFVMGNPVAVNGYLATISVGYDVSDANNQLNGIGFRMHYDSSIYSYSAVQNTLGESVVVDGMGPYQDVENFDNDSTTDSYLVFGWASVSGEWPNVELPAKLSDIKMFVNWADYEAGSTTSNINFSIVDNAEGYEGKATNYAMTVLPATWDFDGNGMADALTDGLMLLRYTFNITDLNMTTGAIADNATLSPTQVVENMQRALPVADIDGNGSTDALTDGLLLLRYMFNLRGESLIAGAVSSDATRTTAEEIEGYIELYMPNELTLPLQSEQNFLVGNWKLKILPESTDKFIDNSRQWNSISSSANDCMMDDIYSFDQNGEFSYDQFGETYNHYGQSVYDISGCQPPSAPWDGTGSYSYNFNEQTAKLTVIGKGAYIGLSYIANGIYRIDEAYFAPDEVTYDFTKINNDEIMLEIDAHTSIHRFTLERVTGN